MEIRAPYVVVGTFVLAVVLAVFGFIYWISRTGGLGERASYQVRFESPVSGLVAGSQVLFNGIRTGEVTDLRLDPAHPQWLIATISVEPSTPIHADTTLDIDYTGLTGVAAIALRGGSTTAPRLEPHEGAPPLLIAGPKVGQTLTQAAREALRRVDEVVADNAKPLHTAIEGFSTFADMLGRNSKRIEGLLGGLEKLTGTGGPSTPTAVFDLAAANDFAPLGKSIDKHIAVPNPTAVLVYDTQNILIRSPQGTFTTVENAKWADNLPKLMQAKVVQSFENAHLLAAVSQPLDDLNSDYRLVLEIRGFQLTRGPAADRDGGVRRAPVEQGRQGGGCAHVPRDGPGQGNATCRGRGGAGRRLHAHGQGTGGLGREVDLSLGRRIAGERLR